MTDVSPKVPIICPHCRAQTSAGYIWHPALDCWNCGLAIWRDDQGRTIGERRQAAEAGTLLDTAADQERSRRAKALGVEVPVTGSEGSSGPCH
jgi:predicted RNA-binding Zn-ribbon protein involved in translation (DUF1610 family)